MYGFQSLWISFLCLLQGLTTTNKIMKGKLLVPFPMARRLLQMRFVDRNLNTHLQKIPISKSFERMPKVFIWKAKSSYCTFPTMKEKGLWSWIAKKCNNIVSHTWSWIGGKHQGQGQGCMGPKTKGTKEKSWFSSTETHIH